MSRFKVNTNIHFLVSFYRDFCFEIFLGRVSNSRLISSVLTASSRLHRASARSLFRSFLLPGRVLCGQIVGQLACRFSFRLFLVSSSSHKFAVLVCHCHTKLFHPIHLCQRGILGKRERLTVKLSDFMTERNRILLGINWDALPM